MASRVQINESIYDYGSMRVDVDGEQYYNITSISYGARVEVGKRRGAGRKYTGRTLGRLELEPAQVTMAREDADALTQALGDGWAAREFTMTVTYGNDGQPLSTDEFIACRLIGRSASPSEGVDSLQEELTIDFMDIRMNGLSPLPDTLQQQPMQRQGNN